MKMKIFFLTFAYTAALASASSYDSKSLNRTDLFKYEIIHKLYEMMGNLIITGSEERNVPIWDPYQFNYSLVNISEKWFSIKANVTYGTLTGLGDFYVAKSDFNDDDISINNKIIFPQIKFTAEYYEMEGSLWDVLPLAGQGKVEVEVHYLTCSGKVYLKSSSNGKAILIDKIENPQFYIENIISRTEFDNNIDVVLNRMIADLLAGYLTRFNGFIANHYTEPLVNFMNSILTKFET